LTSWRMKSARSEPYVIDGSPPSPSELAQGDGRHMAARLTRRRPDGRYQVKVTTVRWRQRRQPVLVRSWKLRPWRPTRQQDEAMARIVFDQVSMAYPGGIQAIDALSLEIGDGEFMV